MLALLALAAVSPDAYSAKSNPSVFKSRETHKTDLKPFPKWTSTLERYLKEKGKLRGGCEQTTFNKCHYKRWQAHIKSLQRKSKKIQLKKVNDFVNQALYIVDPKNWSKKDYWASPAEFFVKNGDCEDYAILKFLTLRSLGWTNDELRIVVVRDMNLKVAHAILVVKRKKKFLILDNQMTLVIEDRRIRHYRPIYSLNEEGWWRHKAAK